MNKAKVIGLTVTVLAVIGGVAVFNYVRKPRKNGEGFFSADGDPEPFGRPKGTKYCVRRTLDGGTIYTVRQGDKCLKGTYKAEFFGDRSNIPL
jgi:hypothetical protein